MKKIITIVIVLIIAGIGLYYIIAKNNYSAPAEITPNVPAITTTSTTPPVSSAPTVPVKKTSVAPAPANVTVNIKNFSFNPSTLTVKAGTKVTWMNNDSAPHTVTSDTGNTLNSSTLIPGQSFSFTFVALGATKYHCNIHPNMKGAIVVTN